MAIGEVEAVLSKDPLDKSGLDIVPRIREAVANVPNATVLVGGTSAINYDVDQANQHDLEIIAPLALVVMAIILAILLQALVAPLVLLASVVLSFRPDVVKRGPMVRQVIHDQYSHSPIAATWASAAPR